MSKKTLRAASALICALGLLLSGAVNAACSVATQQLSISLGTASAFNINSTALASSGAGGMSCTGISIALLADNSLSGIISSTTGQMNLVNEQDTRYKIPYGVYADSGYKNAFNTATALEYGKSGLDLLGLAVISGGLNVTLYVRTTTGATTPVPAGTYSDTITIFWKYHLCSALLCIGNSVEDSSGTSKIKISVVVTKDCKIDSTQSITFAPSALVESFATVTPTVQLTCSLNTPYTAYINNGLNYSAPWRRMKKPTLMPTSSTTFTRQMLLPFGAAPPYFRFRFRGPSDNFLHCSNKFEPASSFSGNLYRYGAVCRRVLANPHC